MHLGAKKSRQVHHAGTIKGLAEQSGVLASLSARRPWVRIPSRPPPRGGQRAAAGRGSDRAAHNIRSDSVESRVAQQQERVPYKHCDVGASPTAATHFERAWCQRQHRGLPSRRGRFESDCPLQDEGSVARRREQADRRIGRRLRRRSPNQRRCTRGTVSREAPGAGRLVEAHVL